MVSLEALCTGNIAINKSDFFAKNAFGSFCDGEMPPFLYANESSIADILTNLAYSHEETIYLQKKSYDFFNKFCNPQRLIEVYNEAYKFDK